MSELISVIVPIYNVEKYLVRCLDSILKSNYTNLEIILVDDGSKDGSVKICDEYQRNDSRIKVIHKKNEGLGYARNSGLEIASGNYVVFVDSDDYIEENMISDLYTDLKANNADTCIGGYKRIFIDHSVEYSNVFAGTLFDKDILVNILAKMLGRTRNHNDFIEMSVWKTMFSLSIIQEHKIVFPSERELISEDIIFDTDYFLYSNKVYISHNTGYCYCDNEGSLTTKYRPERFKLQKKLYLELERRISCLQIENEGLDRIQSTFLSVTRNCIRQEVKFKKEIGISKAYENIRKICNDELLRKIVNVYDSQILTKKSRIVHYCIKHKLVIALMVIMEFKNYFGI